MVNQPGLYYPYIHFRDDNWLKLSALYWPAMARMVPNGYPTEDSHTVRVLREELAFVIDVQPGPAADSTADLFIRLLERHGPELRGALKVNQVTDGLVVSAGHERQTERAFDLLSYEPLSGRTLLS